MRRRADYVTETKQNSGKHFGSSFCIVVWYINRGGGCSGKKMKVCDSGRMTQCGVCKKMDEYNKH